MTLPDPAAGEKKQQQEMSVWSSLQLAWELGYLIAIPVVTLGFGGAYMDKYYHTSPLFIILGFIIAITITTIGVVRKVRSIISSS
jgi:F0F1-type ATP synthase assembly protein I